MAILAEAGRDGAVVDYGLLNKALESGISGDGSDRPPVTEMLTVETKDDDPIVWGRAAGRELALQLHMHMNGRTP